MSISGWIAFAALAILNALFLWGWKPFLKSYMSEKGKRLATYEDIENVLKEVRAVTRETETIKAQIGSDLWLRQTVWGYKREAYANLLKSAHRLQDRLIHLRSTRMVLREQEQKAAPEQHLLNLRSSIAERMTEYAEAHRQFLDALVETEIFLDGLPTLRQQYLDYKWLGIRGEAGADPENALKALMLLGNWITKLVTLAKGDLGVKPD